MAGLVLLLAGCRSPQESADVRELATAWRPAFEWLANRMSRDHHDESAELWTDSGTGCGQGPEKGGRFALRADIVIIDVTGHTGEHRTVCTMHARAEWDERRPEETVTARVCFEQLDDELYSFDRIEKALEGWFEPCEGIVVDAHLCRDPSHGR